MQDTRRLALSQAGMMLVNPNWTDEQRIEMITAVLEPQETFSRDEVANMIVQAVSGGLMAGMMAIIARTAPVIFTPSPLTLLRSPEARP
jgi:predicted PP-loop superfamily ATPase